MPPMKTILTGLLLVLMTGVALVVASVAYALLTPQPVISALGRQYEPAADQGGAHIAYVQNSAAHPNHWDVYVKSASGRVKVNPTGQGFVGGIDGTTLIFQQVVNGQSNLRLYNLSSPALSVPSGVNTTAWEWNPTISGDWILFGRENPNVRPISDRIVLHNTNTNETRVLMTQVGSPDWVLYADQVNGDYASWTRFVPRTSTEDVFRYQISTGHLLKLARPVGKDQYSSAVAADGTVYYVRAGQSCGANAVLRQNVPGASDTALATLPAGYDVTKMFLVDEGGGVFSLYFDRSKCSTGAADIYKVTIS
jgi:hypothetical protein